MLFHLEKGEIVQRYETVSSRRHILFAHNVQLHPQRRADAAAAAVWGRVVSASRKQIKSHCKYLDATIWEWSYRSRNTQMPKR